MTLRSKLLATVAAPVLSAVMMAEPALVLAANRTSEARVEAEPTGIQIAQAEITCSDGSPAPDQATCDAIDAQRAEEEAARKAAEEEAAQQAEQEAARQAEEEAARQAEEEAARQAEQQAQQQAEEEAARQAAEQEAAQQAEQEAQRQAEEEAQRQAAEQEAARQAEEDAARQAEEEAARKAAQEAQEQAEQPAAEAVTCPDGSQAASPDACPVNEAQPETEPQQEQQAEQPAAEPEQPAQQAEEPAENGQPSAEQAEEPAAESQEPPQEQVEQPPVDDELRPAQDAGEAVTPSQEPTGQQAGDEEVPGGEQVLVPAVEPPADQTISEVVDTRTEEEKQAIADDPSATAETIVLPVEGGAAVLDSDKDADNSGQVDVRDTRTELREQAEAGPPPESDADAQVDAPKIAPEVIQQAVGEEGTRLEAEPVFEVPTTVVNNVTNVTNVTNNVTNNTNVVNQVTEVRVVEQIDDRTVINVGNRIVVRHDDRQRLRYEARDTYYEELPRGRVRETIERSDGSRLVTVYNRFGDVIVRSRYTPRGEEYVLFYSPEADGERPRMYVDVGESLPPMRLNVPVSDYIVTMSNEPDLDYYDFLARPPVERVERVYSIDEVKSSARLRDKVRRIDLDTITFASGSAEVSLSQAKTLRSVAGAMEQILERDPGEVFLIEGHTDAVGSDQSNLVLSDERAETVANLLTEVYGIPPENMSTQGYGERYLKIRTQGDEERNRRVTIRRVTPLVKPVAAR